MHHHRWPLPVALTVAGSDSGGGAGIQGDVRVFHRFGVHGTSALTLVTAQTLDRVRELHTLPAAWVEQQIDAVLSSTGCDAAKTGALGTEEGVRCVARTMERYGVASLVVDPVVHASDGTVLLNASGVEALRTHLLPLATLVTPNVAEAEILGGIEIRTARDLPAAARAVHATGARAVLVKGGHLEGPDSVDIFFDGHEIVHLPAPRTPGPAPHGTGCAYSAAITAHLALGDPLPRAVRAAKAFISRAIRAAPQVESGAPPLQLWA